jgi:hypothetical protein
MATRRIGIRTGILGVMALSAAMAFADPGQDMIATLPASGPHASLADQANVWARFIGTWDCEYTFFAADGRVTRSPGELRFGWVLDGRAIQDLWILYDPKDPTGRHIGTSLRFFDPTSKQWRVVFVNPEFNAITTVQGGVEGNRIVLRGDDGNGTQKRWSFNDIERDSFTWRGEKSVDGGKTWTLAEEHHMRRRTRSAPASAN